MSRYVDNETGKIRELLIGTTPNYVVFDETTNEFLGLFSQTVLRQRFSPVKGGEDD